MEIFGRCGNFSVSVAVKSFAPRTCETKSASAGICALSSRSTAGSVHANIPAFQR